MTEPAKVPSADPNSPMIVSWVARIYRESMAKLDDYSKRVRQGLDAQAALEFGGFILWSGVTSLCREYARPSPKIDESLLRWKAEELQRDARSWLSRPNQDPKVDAEQIAGINRRLDLIAGQIQRRCHL